MYSYSLTQWVLFFFIYCFFGWIWECFYVSVTQAWKQRKWRFINRGFLHGPLIPIYGFAAIAILLATIRLREDTMAVYVLGALTATLFELVTGTAMERMFEVKYWDYSNLPLNYHGHICFFVSLFWGFFAVLLVEIIHVPIERFLLKLPTFPCEIAAFSLMAVAAYDASQSVNEALDLREVLRALSEHNEAVRRLEARVNARLAFTPLPDLEDIRGLRYDAKENLIYNVERLRRGNEERINRIKDRLQLPEFESLPERQELLEKLESHRKSIMRRSNQQYLRAVSQLKRNPNVKTLKYQESLELLNSLLKKRNETTPIKEETDGNKSA